MKRIKNQNPAELVINNAIIYLKKIKPIIYTKNFQKIIELIKTHRIWITGAGKMAFVSQKFATTLSCNNIQANFLDPSQALHGCLGAVHSDELVIIISNSGKTDEIVQIAQKLNEKNIKIIVITSSIDSPLSKFSDLILNYGPIIEACSLGLTPTTSCLVILAICDALAMSVQQAIGTTYDDYVWNHHRGWIGEIARQKANKKLK